MSKGPKAQAYQPSETDKVNASVAVERKNRFDSLYGDLLLQLRDESAADDVTKVARSRASADVAQAVSTPNLGLVNNVDRTGTVTAAYEGQLGSATAKANEITNKRQSGVLAVANKMESDTTRGMGLVARLDTSEALQRAKADTVVQTAKTSALGEVGTAATLYGLDKADMLPT